ncbi:MAG: hypothetical protein KatS3mg110_1515 [Pirellulaceae bacterium]|nr:MAG: hypothetical protein KatS3mg110_1515 [Pirellulaceae bacterium]
MVASDSLADVAIELLRDAAHRMLNSPGRHGSLLELSAELADEVLIAGDLHGHRLNFHKIVRQAALEAHPRRHLVLQEVCHGGPSYPDNQGCMSHLLLEDIAQLVVNYPGRVHFLLGNHEWAELKDYPIRKGMSFLNYQFCSGISTFYGPRAQDVQRAYLAFLSASLLAVRIAGGLFISHSATPLNAPLVDLAMLRRPLEELDLSSGGPVYHMLWGRDYRPQAAERFARSVEAELLVHGHEPCPEGFATPNDRQIILDSSQEPACGLLVRAGQPLDQQQALEKLVLFSGSRRNAI